MHNYTNDYRTLGLTAAANWREIRSSYRTLIRQWHPDRFTDDPHQRGLAEEKTKELTRAYQSLEQYYRHHGEPPAVMGEPASENLPPSPQSAPEQPSHPGARNIGATPKWLRRRQIATAVVLLGVAALMSYLASDSNSLTQPVDSSESPDSINQAVEEKSGGPDHSGSRFNVGSTPGEVFSAQGVPTQIEGNTWRYGKSMVYFDRGTVSNWTEHPDDPLRVALVTSSAAMHAAFFTYGSTKAEVREIQGKPTRETARTWEYGASRISFNADRVSGWHESPFYPLKAVKK